MSCSHQASKTFTIDFIKLSTYPEVRLVPPQRGPGARHLHCPDSSVVSSQKPPLLQFKHYFMFFWCWKTQCCFCILLTGSSFIFMQVVYPQTSYRWSTDFFVKQKSVIFVFFIVVNLIVSFFYIIFWRNLAACFFFFFFYQGARFGSVRLDFKWCVYVVQSSFHITYSHGPKCWHHWIYFITYKYFSQKVSAGTCLVQIRASSRTPLKMRNWKEKNHI